MDQRPESLSRAMYVWLILSSLVLGILVVLLISRYGHAHDRRAIVVGSIILGYPVGAAILVIRMGIASRLESRLRPLRHRVFRALRSRPRDPAIPLARVLLRASTSERLTK